MNEKYPIQNQRTEEECCAVKEMQKKIEGIAKGMFLVKEMQPYILSNICVTFQEPKPTIPSDGCIHTGQARSGSKQIKMVIYCTSF